MSKLPLSQSYIDMNVILSVESIPLERFTISFNSARAILHSIQSLRKSDLDRSSRWRIMLQGWTLHERTNTLVVRVRSTRRVSRCCSWDSSVNGHIVPMPIKLVMLRLLGISRHNCLFASESVCRAQRSVHRALCIPVILFGSRHE